MSSGSRGLSLRPSGYGFLQRAITFRSLAHPRVHPRMPEVVTLSEGGGEMGPTWSGPSPPAGGALSGGFSHIWVRGKMQCLFIVVIVVIKLVKQA